MAQWLRICLPMLGTWIIQSLVWENSRYLGQLSLCAITTEPVFWSPGTANSELTSCNCGAHVPQLLKYEHPKAHDLQ